MHNKILWKEFIRYASFGFFLLFWRNRRIACFSCHRISRLFIQAILDAVAKAKHQMMCEVVAEEYGTTVSDKEIPIFTQSGDNRYENSDKMIIKQADVLPHALINNVKTKLGEHGELLEEYVAWLRDRILKLRTREDYLPVFHIDVYGTIGAAFGNDNFEAMADYLAKLEEIAKPFHLRIEGPMDVEAVSYTRLTLPTT